MLEKVLPTTGSKMRMLQTVYENPGINVSGVIRKAKASPNTVVNYVRLLVKYDVLIQIRKGGEKKVYMKELRPNINSEMGALIFTLIEMEKKTRFITKYKKFKPIINQLEELFSSDHVFGLIYGSFARYEASAQSDVDMLIVGSVNKKEQQRISDIMTTLNRAYSIEIESLDEFVKNTDNPFHQAILKNHVVIFGTTVFIEVLANG